MDVVNQYLIFFILYTYTTMKFRNYFNGLKSKNAHEITTRELSLLVRENALSKMFRNETWEVDTEAVMNQLEAEYNKAVELNSVANVTTTTGGAKELVPENVMMSTLIDLGNISPNYAFLSALVGKHTLTAQTQTVPIIGRPGKARILGEMLDSDQIKKAKDGIQKANSDKITIISKKIYNSAIISVELEKYTVVELDAIITGRIKAGMLLSMADAIINGDMETWTGNVNYKGAAVTTISNYESEPRFAYDNGLRKAALKGTKSSIDIGVIEGANDIFKLQGLTTSTSDASKKIILMDLATYYAFLEKEDFKDAAKNGKNSTIYTGAITNIAGSDLFVTDLILKAGADGFVSKTASENTTGTIIVFDVTAIQHGDFDDLLYNTEKDFAVGTLLEAFGFWGFENLQGKDKLNFVSIGYNVTHA